MSMTSDMEWRAAIHAKLPEARYRDSERVMGNFARAVPGPMSRHLSANQIFKRMALPRLRTMRHVEAELDFWWREGEVEIEMNGHQTLYRWAA